MFIDHDVCGRLLSRPVVPGSSAVRSLPYCGDIGQEAAVSRLPTASGRTRNSRIPPQFGPSAHPSRSLVAAASLPALLVSALFLASCVGSGRMQDASLALGPAEPDELARTMTAGPAGSMPGRAEERVGGASSADGGPNAPQAPRASAAVSDPAAAQAGANGKAGGRLRVSLRPIDNIDAEDLLDHWGHRRLGQLFGILSQAPEPGADVAAFRGLLEAAGKVDEDLVPGLLEGDAATVLGQRRGLTYGRWTGGAADTLSIEFNLEHARETMRGNRAFGAALERAGKVWSRRIDDSWTAWERRYGESKGRLIGNYGIDGREIRVGPGRETSTGLEVFITGVDLGGNSAGQGGPRTLRPDRDWEPHTGAIAFDADHVQEAGEADLFHTMVHEIGHVIGAWYGADRYLSYRPEIDREAGTWTGPHVIAVHGGPAPFQDADDAYGWHDGERNPDGSRFDYYHSGVCASVMAYCAYNAAVPAFLPAGIDYAFLADIGLAIRPETARPETYGLAVWMEHAAFTLSVSRELDISLADPQPRYFGHGARWTTLDTVDLLRAEADAFGSPGPGGPARTFPLGETVNYAGGLIGAAIDQAGLPPVVGDASLSIGLEDLVGKASFTSLRVLAGGERDVFGEGSLHYPVAVAGNRITAEAAGVSLVAGFYGPRHEEIAGTLDDSRAGLLASFGARQDERPGYVEVVAGADRIQGMMYQDGWSEDADGWRRYRCGAGPDCEGRFEWWKPVNEWYDVSATQDRSPRERVLDWTGGWGNWMSEDPVADYGGVRISRRYARTTDGRRGRYSKDGYYGVMKNAAFGTGFYGYQDWETREGELWDFYIRGTGFQGNISGTRPPGGAVWEGRMVGYQSGLEADENPFVQGDARVRVSFGRDRVAVGFSGVTSMDFRRPVESFGFDNIRLEADGAFDGFDRGHLEGAFFGRAHEEVAGMFQNNDNNVTGSFGAVGRQ